MNITPEGQKKLAQEGLERQGMRNARKIDQDFAEKERARQEDRNRLEIQGRDNVKQFEKERSAKEEATAKKLSGGFVGLAMLQGRAVDSKAVAQVMKAAGIDVGPGGQRGKEVRKDMVKDLNDEISAKMAETGANRVQARAMVELEHRNRLMGGQQQQGGRSEMVGITEFAKKIQMGALNSAQDTLLKQQLQKMEEIRRAIIQGALRGQAPLAVAGGPA
jgi:hypothetical protein